MSRVTSFKPPYYCCAVVPGRQQGVALLIVLWVLVLLSIVSGTLALLARAENLEARTLFDGTRARMGAIAGIQRAVFEMRNPDQESKWIADGRGYQFQLDDMLVTVEVTDESGKLDLNAASPELLFNLLFNHSDNAEMAEALVDAILDWRDPDDATRPLGAEADAYDAAGLSWIPPNQPFVTVEELQQVLGMSYALYEQIEPALTVFSGRADVNAGFASVAALLALPQMDRTTAQSLVAQREQQTGLDRQPLTLPDGSSALAQGGGLTYSVRSRGTLNNGAFAQVEATFRLGTDLLGRPFRIVRWREGVGSG
jgi:general secretion pathway protein K